ncbi:group 3 secretory phospholipase A2-like protein [Lates japonicus]|uniref:phospholipase A2 n=1 Tax=Lates japonicus TaxID=270547 RepID=A0AAD3R6I0_LATJO|nr:group 3 secretory phospholipase A2-like protein [Lates japonicus]
MTHIAPLVTVILTSSLLRWTAAQASILCSWTKVLPNEEVHYSFLRQDSPSARLYHSAWSGERALLGCAWSEDASVIQNYLSLCLERAQEFSDHPDQNFDLDSLFDDGGQCVSVASPKVAELGYHSGKRPVRSAGGLLTAENSQGQDERSEVRTHVRVKRGFIVPGTLWCGSGNKAPSYADLGVFADTDSCCREHDQCKHTILSFHSEFGVFNTNIFTMSHCDCDNKFRTCLREANDSISDVVGYTFFNLLKMHCFEFSHRLQCTQRNWFGMCKETKMALYAEDADLTEMQLSCGVYKDLDKCRNKILPQQRRFGLHNPEPRTLYHCNCTSRLFQTLAQQRQLTEVQALLLGHVSQSCFLPQDCTAGKICTAVLVRADLPQLDWRSGAEVEEQRHLQAVKLKVRRPNTRRAKRKDRAVRLHKLCLRMTWPKQTNKTRKHGPNAPRPAV